MQIIHSPQAPQAIGPYSQAIRIENTLYLSGQIGLDPQTAQIVYGGIVAQTRQVLDNITAVLQAGGCDLNNVVQSTIYLTNMDDFEQVNNIYGQYFDAHKPARVTIAVSALPKNALIEISCIASRE
jgi:2-iminobutanoate/2-iminopropanoate deaminase